MNLLDGPYSKINVSMPQRLLEHIEQLALEQGRKSRSEMICVLIRDGLRESTEASVTSENGISATLCPECGSTDVVVRESDFGVAYCKCRCGHSWAK